MEIERRRRQAGTDGNENPSTAKGSTTKSLTKSIIRSEVKPFKPLPAGMLKNDQHDQLMEEFRRVHRKMFSPPSNASTDESEKESEAEKEKGLERNESNPIENVEEERKDKIMMQTSVKVEPKQMQIGKAMVGVKVIAIVVNGQSSIG